MDLNQRQIPYERIALPLSYYGINYSKNIEKSFITVGFEPTWELSRQIFSLMCIPISRSNPFLDY